MRALGVGVLLAIALSASAFGQDRQTAWSARGLAIFGETYVIDIQRRVENGAGLRLDLVDCTNQDFFCSKAGAGGLFHLVLPRHCGAWRVGERWSLSGVETSVLRAEKEYPYNAHLIEIPEYYLLGDRSRPHTVFIYAPQLGIGGVFSDLTGKVDLVSIAEKEGYAGLRAVVTPPRRYEFPLLSPDRVGVCDKAAQSRSGP